MAYPADATGDVKNIHSVDLNQWLSSDLRQKRKTMGLSLMRTHSTLFIAAVGGILASSLAFQSLAQAQAPGTKGSAPVFDCNAAANAYWDATNINVVMKTLAGTSARDEELSKTRSESRAAADKIQKTYAERTRAELIRKAQELDNDLMAAFRELKPYFDAQDRARDAELKNVYDASSEKERQIENKFRETNPELKALWDAFQDCMKRQQEAEQQAIKKLAPHITEQTAEDLIVDILMRVRVAPDPDEELRLTQENAVAEIKSAMGELEKEASTPDKPRKRATRKPAGGAEETTQTHSPDASAVTIMLLGTAAGITAESLRHRGSGGGGGTGGGGGGGTPEKRRSGGCTGGTCPR